MTGDSDKGNVKGAPTPHVLLWAPSLPAHPHLDQQAQGRPRPPSPADPDLEQSQGTGMGPTGSERCRRDGLQETTRLGAWMLI